MPNARDPFELDEGIENIPVVKVPVAGVNKVANTGTKYVKQQAKALTKAFVSQLYGTTQQAATDDDQQGVVAKTDPVSAAKKTMATPVYFSQQSKKAVNDPAAAATTPIAKTPEEQEQLEETRKALFSHKDYYDTLSGGRLGDLEQDISKEAQKRKQEEEKKKQEQEQEEKQKKEQEAKQQNEQLNVPKGRVRGQPPGVLKRSQTKAENKTGFSG